MKDRNVILAMLGIAIFNKDENGNEVFSAEQKELLTKEFSAEKVTFWENNVLKKAGGDEVPEDNDQGTQNSVETDEEDSEDNTSLTQEERDTAVRLMGEQIVKERQNSKAQAALLQTLLNQNAPNGVNVSNNHQNNEQLNNNKNGLMGSHDPLMSLDFKWNKRAHSVINGGSFNDDFKYSSTDIEVLKEQLGAYYRERYKLDLISWVRKNDSLEELFPKESNVRDQQVLVNVFLGQFSQAFQDTWTPKGKFYFEPEILRLYDVKLDHVFSNLKAIERSWISYLNKEGSKAIKWSFVHYLLMEVTKQLQKERTARAIRGVYKKPIDGKAGHYLHAANGLLKQMKIYISDKKVKPFNVGAWPELGTYQWTKDFLKLIPKTYREEGLVVIASHDYKIHLLEDERRLFGRDSDFKGEKGEISILDTIKVKACPEMGDSKRVIVTLPKNFRQFEGKANEMTDFELETEKRQLNVISDWKEGFQAIMVGKKRSDAEWEAEDVYNYQMIFCNDVDEPEDYFVEMMENVQNPSVLEHTSIVSSTFQDTPLEITDIQDAEVGAVISIKSRYSYDTQGIKIMKSGLFASIASDWTPKAGDVIKVMKIASGNFIEIERSDKTSLITLIPADATTFSADGALEFKVSENTAATALTNITDMIPGQTYTIYGNGSSNETTIANGGSFMLTGGAMSLTDGTFIKLVYSDPLSKIVEISRG